MNYSPYNNLIIKEIKSDSKCITAMPPRETKYPLRILPHSVRDITNDNVKDLFK